MANIKSARKRARQSEKRRQHNMAMRSKVRTQIKKVLAAIAAGNKEDATARYKEAVPVIDAMVSKGILHRNKADRHKKRLNNSIKAIAA